MTTQNIGYTKLKSQQVLVKHRVQKKQAVSMSQTYIRKADRLEKKLKTLITEGAAGQGERTTVKKNIIIQHW